MYLILFLILIPLTFLLGNSNLKLHKKASANLSKLSLAYFDDNPLGVTLNKFTKDTSSMDKSLMQLFQEITIVIPPFMGSLLILMIIQPFTIITFVLFIIEFIFMSKYVLPVVYDLRRLGIVLNGPIVSLSCTVLAGLSTIRSLKLQPFLNKKMKEASYSLYRLQITAEHFVLLYCGTMELGLMLITIINIAFIMARRGYVDTHLSIVTLGILICCMSYGASAFSFIVRFDTSMLSVQNLFTLSELPSENKSREGLSALLNQKAR